MSKVITEKLKILVVEDTPGDVFLIKFYLEELDPDLYEIESVNNLGDAHKKLAIQEYDVVLLDFHLPDSEGMDTLTSSVEKFPNQIFIVLTGLSDELIGIEAVNKGAQDFLVKGRIDGKVLDSSIKFAVNRSQMKSKINRYAEALNVMEELVDTMSFIVTIPDEKFEHSAAFLPFFDLETTVDTLSDFAQMFDESEDLLEHCRGLGENNILSLNVSSRQHNYKLKLKRGLKNNLIVGVVTKLG